MNEAFTKIQRTSKFQEFLERRAGNMIRRKIKNIKNLKRLKLLEK